MHGTLPVSSLVALCSLATYHLDGRMDLSVETVLDSNRRHLPESIFWSGNWLMMDQILTPSKTVTKQFPAPLIPQSDGRQRRLPSSTSTLLMHHQHRNPHGLKTLYPDEEIYSIRFRGRRLLHTRSFYYVGERETSKLIRNGTRSTLDRLSRNSAKHLPENMIHLFSSITSTTTCLTVRLHKRD